MARTLIVARMNRENTAAVRQAFTESDATELPHLLGVVERRLYRFHDLYFHCIDSDEALAAPLAEVRGNPLWTGINERLSPLVTAYDPPTWKSPKDAMAEEFYRWSASR